MVFGALAEYARTLTQGSLVLVQGAVRSREYDKDGIKHRVCSNSVPTALANSTAPSGRRVPSNILAMNELRGSCAWPTRARRNDSRFLAGSSLRPSMRRVPL